MLGRALAAAETDDCYQALKLARRVIQHEDAVLGRTPAASFPTRSESTAMQTMNRAANAYQQAAARRSLREQEADVFRHATGALRTARGEGNVQRARAIADNRRLWLAVKDIMGDSENALPLDLRASIASLAITVGREMERDSPDFDFLISINEHLAAGLGAHE